MVPFALQSLLELCVQRGALTLELSDGRRLTAGDGSGQPIHVVLGDSRAGRELFLHPDVALGELYTDGRLRLASGSIFDLLDLLGRNLPNLNVPHLNWLRRGLRAASERLHQRNSESRSKHNVHHHYDIDDRIYSLFLDKDRQYSCAYFEHDGQSLEEAQLAKKRHIAGKLLVPSGAKVLDIGSGWGGLALYLANVCGGDVTGLTLSTEQLKVAERRAFENGLSSRVHFKLQDYRALEGAFDRIVSVGMFEHVGLRDYDTFFGVVSRALKDDGIVLLHSIGRLDGCSPMNPWFEKYIFPGSYVPSLAEVMPSIERSGLMVTDIEILRLHYADTLAAWRARFMGRRSEAAAALGEPFCRRWEYYLASAEIGFRYGGLMVFQIQLTKKIDAVPRTRTYIGEEEMRLREVEQSLANRTVAAE